jgi:hypothetical protein
MLLAGCSNNLVFRKGNDSEIIPAPTVLQNQTPAIQNNGEIAVGETDDLGGTVIAVEQFDNGFNISDMVGVSRDRRYYLFQIDSSDGEDKLNDNVLPFHVVLTRGYNLLHNVSSIFFSTVSEISRSEMKKK